MYWYRGTLGPARVGFTNRGLGNVALHVPDDERAVLRRRRALEHDLEAGAGSLLFLDQVHGATVADGDAADLGAVPTADAAVSAAGRPLAVMVADCVPVLFAGTDPGDAGVCVTAVAHAGRAGLLAGVLQATAQAMRERGAVEIRALVGPSVCGACYEVPEDMAAGAERELPGIRAMTSWGTPSLDLPATAVRVLDALGVRTSRPADAPTTSCTVENQALSSHRRDPGSGRIAGVIAGPLPAVPNSPKERV
ncbi:laccase domain-containing protein [Kocuria coralli]|uniref:Laccase domain-containing protein n=1 Tax=Kocuria coralli TaxID=1461025 RepID=A0A5J5KXL7_9MICC|nr:polyphenol oxidase family protein [Kocuria coralli]KAA9394419.1 laccase domain-containing protein [Kocuria coralli]